MTHLEPSDFFISQDRLCTKLKKGYSVVFFYSDHCDYCTKIKSQFNGMNGKIQGCDFVYMDMTNDNVVKNMSEHTNNPIRRVPMILFYVEGIPVDEFFYNKLSKFAHDLTEWIVIKTTEYVKYARDQQKSQSPLECDGGICPTSIGKPKPTSKTSSHKAYDGAYVYDTRH